MEEIEAWIARDSNGMLYMFMSKPQRFLETWGVLGIGFFKLDESLFPEVKWSDKEPTKVKLVIEK